mgnify:CR=1 FL=1
MNTITRKSVRLVAVISRIAGKTTRLISDEFSGGFYKRENDAWDSNFKDKEEA